MTMVRVMPAARRRGALEGSCGGAQGELRLDGGEPEVWRYYYVLLRTTPGNHNMVQEWCSGNTKNTKWPTVGSGQSKYGIGLAFWAHEEHEVAYSWLRAFKMWPGNGVVGTRRARSGLQLAPGIQNVAREWSSTAHRPPKRNMSPSVPPKIVATAAPQKKTSATSAKMVLIHVRSPRRRPNRAKCAQTRKRVTGARGANSTVALVCVGWAMNVNEQPLGRAFPKRAPEEGTAFILWGGMAQPFT